MNVERIKCPDCGNSAQIQLLDNGTNYFSRTYKEYKCGCGCHFEVIFEAVEVCVIKEQK